MIFAAGMAAQAAAALAQSMQTQNTPGAGSASGGSSFTADIDALFSSARNGLAGAASSAGAILGNLQSLGHDLLGLAPAQPTPPAPAAGAAQSYAAAATLGT